MVPLPRLDAISPSVAASRYRTGVFANACVNWFTLVLAVLRQHGSAGPAIWSQTLVVTAWKGRSFGGILAGSFFLAGYGTISRVTDCFVGKGGLPQKPC